MKIRVINDSIRLLFNKNDVERVKSEQVIENPSREQGPQLFGQMTYGVELVECKDEGAVFTGSKMKFFLSKRRVLSWFEKGENKCSQMIPTGHGGELHLIMEKTNFETSCVNMHESLRRPMF